MGCLIHWTTIHRFDCICVDWPMSVLSNGTAGVKIENSYNFVHQCGIIFLFRNVFSVATERNSYFLGWMGLFS